MEASSRKLMLISWHAIIITKFVLALCDTRKISPKCQTIWKRICHFQMCPFRYLVTFHPEICKHPLRHDDVINGKYFPYYWAFVRGIHRWPVDSPHKGPVTRSWWFKSLLHSLWCHCNDVMKYRYMICVDDTGIHEDISVSHGVYANKELFFFKHGITSYVYCIWSW